jgi:hypothetical protein
MNQFKADTLCPNSLLPTAVFSSKPEWPNYPSFPISVNWLIDKINLIFLFDAIGLLCSRLSSTKGGLNSTLDVAKKATRFVAELRRSVSLESTI